MSITDPWPDLARHRGWLHYGALRVYVRKTERYLGGSIVSTIEVGNVEVDAALRGKGLFTSYLTELESGDRTVFVESVLNTRLAAFLRKRGFKEIPCPSGVAPSFWR